MFCKLINVISFLVVDTRSVETTIIVGQNMQMCHSLRSKLLAERTWVRVSRRPPKLRAVILVLVFRFCKYVVFCPGLSLTRR